MKPISWGVRGLVVRGVELLPRDKEAQQGGSMSKGMKARGVLQQRHCAPGLALVLLATVC